MRLTQHRYLLPLVTAAILILAVGYSFRPRKALAKTVVSEAERFRLQMLAQKRSLQNSAQYFANLAARMGSAMVVALPGPANGIAWDRTGSIVVASAGRPEFHAILAESNTRMGLIETWWAPGFPVAGYSPERAAELQPVAEIFTGAVDTGALAIVVWRRPNNSIAFLQGAMGGAAEIDCGTAKANILLSSIPLENTVPGAGVFDLDGRLIGMVVRCGPANPMVIVAASAVDSYRADSTLPKNRVLRRLGLGVAALTQASTRDLSTKEGVLVEAVWDGYPADGAGIEPGDVLTKANGQILTSVEVLAEMSNPPEAAVTLSVTRQRGPSRDVVLPAASQEGFAPPLALQLAPPATGRVIWRVGAESPAAGRTERGRPGPLRERPAGRIARIFATEWTLSS